MPYLSTTLVTAARVGVRTTEVLGHEKGQCFIAQEGLTDFGFAEEELSWKVPKIILVWVMVVMWVWVRGWVIGWNGMEVELLILCAP